MSQGEFTGIVADTIDQPIKHKAFRGIVSPSKADLGKEKFQMIDGTITSHDLILNQKRIQEEINELVEEQMEWIKELEDIKKDKSLEKENDKTKSDFYEQQTENAFIKSNDEFTNNEITFDNVKQNQERIIEEVEIEEEEEVYEVGDEKSLPINEKPYQFKSDDFFNFNIIQLVPADDNKAQEKDKNDNIDKINKE